MGEVRQLASFGRIMRAVAQRRLRPRSTLAPIAGRQHAGALFDDAGDHALDDPFLVRIGAVRKYDATAVLFDHDAVVPHGFAHGEMDTAFAV